MAYYGYHRTSTKEQHLDRGVNEITEFCNTNNYELKKIYTDQITGKNFSRPAWEILKNHVLRDEEDVLIITELDRLGRNKKGILKEIRALAERHIRIMILELPTTLIDYSGMDNAMAKMMMETINNMLIELYASLAQAEIEKKEKRQREGIEAKKKRGDWSNYGRPNIPYPKNYENVIKMWESGEMTAVQAMAALSLKKTTFYKLYKQYKNGELNTC